MHTGYTPFHNKTPRVEGVDCLCSYKNPLISTHRTTLSLGSTWARTTTPCISLAYLVVGCIAGIKASHPPCPKVDTNQGLREVPNYTRYPLYSAHPTSATPTPYSPLPLLYALRWHTRPSLSLTTHPTKPSPVTKATIQDKPTPAPNASAPCARNGIETHLHEYACSKMDQPRTVATVGELR